MNVGRGYHEGIGCDTYQGCNRIDVMLLPVGSLIRCAFLFWVENTGNGKQFHIVKKGKVNG